MNGGRCDVESDGLSSTVFGRPRLGFEFDAPRLKLCRRERSEDDLELRESG